MTTTTSWSAPADPPRRTLALGLALGAAAGLLAVALLAAGSPPRAAIYLGGIAGAVLTLASPQFGMLALSSLMIAQWPGQVLKLGAAGV
ncbi:MAG: hypothetical protein HGA45_44715, partial [Chloroflexales bacterium]|nr:hypothetical protein [Chloroflexales bacterium]